MSAFTVNAASGSCGDGLTWTLSDGTLTISGSGAMANYDYFNRAPWDGVRSTIKKVVIGEGVTTVGNYAFYQCTALTDITFPSSGLISIGDEAIRECESLVTLTLPEGLETIGLIAIAYNPKLTGVYIPDSVTRIRNMAFAQCTALKEIEYPASVTEVEGYIFSGCTALERVVLPDGITKIGLGAFEVCEKMTEINIPDTVTYIRSSAFAYCKALESITLSANLTRLETDVFSNCPSLTVRCYEGSYVHNYCVSNSLSYEFVAPCQHSYTSMTTTLPTCTGEGVITYTCECGDSYTEPVSPLGHAWRAWTVTKEPTTTSVGEETRTCRRGCGAVETREVPMLTAIPEITVENYDVTITCADSIKDMRYALGEYTTTTEIRNAEGNVALDNSLVQKYTVNGSFVYEMPKGGYYTIWIRMTDGTNYILPLDVTNFTPTVTTYGVKVTLHDLYDVKDFYIAKGEYETYREIKDNGYIVSISGAKIGTKHDYTYTVYEPGMHTVLIRYNDGSTAVFHEELTVDEPVFTTNGLQVTVSNLPDVKVIRTAYGEWSTTRELKATDTLRNFSAKTAIKDKDPYTIQYREEGIVTVIVEYNNGYVKVFHYDVQQKTPTVEQNGNTVTFGNLDGLNVLRYAKGEYTTVSQIKTATASKALKASSIVDGNITVTLDIGTYTFCVQYDDESYNYYTITVE